MMQAIRILSKDENKKCDKTGKPAQIQYYNFHYTSGAFLGIVQQKVKKQLLGQLDRKQETTLDSDLGLYYCKKLYPTFTFTKKKESMIISWSMDDEILAQWKELKGEKVTRPKGIPLFLHVQDRELHIVSDLLHIPITIKQKEYPFDELDNQFYGVKTTLLKNTMQIKTLGKSP